MKHLEAAIDTSIPNADRLVKAARVTFQLNQVGVPVRFQVGFKSRTTKTFGAFQRPDFWAIRAVASSS